MIYILRSSHAAKVGDKMWRIFVVKVIIANKEQTSPQNDVTGKTHSIFNKSFSSLYYVIYGR